MAQKKITDYQLISAITSTVNFFVDDLTQNYRATAQQIKDYVLSTGSVPTAALADLAVTAGKLAAGAVTDAKTSFTPPTIQRFLSGSGTYTTPAGVKYITVEMVGGGGGGAGASTTNLPSSGTAGGNTTFGSSLLVANGGGGGAWGSGVASGGTASVASPALALIGPYSGMTGSGFSYNYEYAIGGYGGVSPFGGAGTSQASGAGMPAIDNTGSGGGGGANSSPGAGSYSGNGGAAGGYLKALITNPSATYAYSVGSMGTGGAGNGGRNGGNGSKGVIIVTEYYQ